MKSYSVFYSCFVMLSLSMIVSSFIVSRKSQPSHHLVGSSYSSMDTVFDSMIHIINDMDRWVPSPISASFIPTTSSSAASPSLPMDVKETKDAFELVCDLPGIDKKDISLTIKDKLLMIAAERKTTPQLEEGKQEDKVCYRRLERFSGAVTRTIKLPDSIDRDRITAICKDGQLTITLPKQEKEELSIRNIEIK